MAGDARLFVLATIDRLGEAYGQEVLREAQIDHVDDWAHISTGGIYSSLRKLAQEGHISGVRSEQLGRYPARTVYQLSDSGREALARARHEALTAAGLPLDPFDLALSLSDGSDPAQLRAAVSARLDWYRHERQHRAEALSALADRLEPAAAAVFRHVLVRLDTEIAWHEGLLDSTDDLVIRRTPN